LAKRTWVIVGGQLELKAMKAKCRGCCVRILPGAHGDMPPAGLAKQVHALLSPFVSQISDAVLVLDREMSQQSAGVLEKRILNVLDKLIDLDVTVVCPDRMIENWMLADVVGIKRKTYIQKKAKQKNYEGTHGKHELKKIFTSKSAYRETSHGVELLAMVRDAQASKNSASYAKFMSAFED